MFCHDLWAVWERKRFQTYSVFCWWICVKKTRDGHPNDCIKCTVEHRDQQPDEIKEAGSWLQIDKWNGE